MGRSCLESSRKLEMMVKRSNGPQTNLYIRVVEGWKFLEKFAMPHVICVEVQY